MDTSIWIEFLRAKEPYLSLVSEALEDNRVIAFEPVFGELLQGAKSRHENDAIRGYWENLPRYSIADLWIEAGILSQQKHLISRGVGLIDAAIYMVAIEKNAKVWTLDKKLLSIMEEKYIFKINF